MCLYVNMGISHDHVVLPNLRVICELKHPSPLFDTFCSHLPFNAGFGHSNQHVDQAKRVRFKLQKGIGGRFQDETASRSSHPIIHIYVIMVFTSIYQHLDDA